MYVCGCSHCGDQLQAHFDYLLDDVCLVSYTTSDCRVCVCVPLAVFILLYYCEIYINQVIGKCTEVLSVKLIKQPLTFQFTVKFLLHGTSLIQHYYYIWQWLNHITSLVEAIFEVWWHCPWHWKHTRECLTTVHQIWTFIISIFTYKLQVNSAWNYYYYHTRLTASFPGQPG